MNEESRPKAAHGIDGDETSLLQNTTPVPGLPAFECTAARPYSPAAIVAFALELQLRPGAAHMVDVVHDVAPTGYCRFCWTVFS